MSVYGEAVVRFRSEGFTDLKPQLEQIGELLDGLKTKTSALATGFTNVADQLRNSASKLAEGIGNKRKTSEEVEAAKAAKQEEREQKALEKAIVAAETRLKREDEIYQKRLETYERFLERKKELETKEQVNNAINLEKMDKLAEGQNRRREAKELQAIRDQQIAVENERLKRYARDNGYTAEQASRIESERRTQLEINNLMRRSRMQIDKEMEAFSNRRMRQTKQSEFIPGGDLAHQIRDMFTLAVAGFALATPMREAAYFEKLKVQFETLTGSMERSKQVYADLVMFAAETPFQFAEVADMSKKFELFGGAALNTKENLRIVGDAGAASGRDLELVSFWVARLYGMLKDNQTFGEQAIHLQKLGLMSGYVREQMVKMQEAGVQGEKIFDFYLQSLKRFSGGMEQMARTSHGLWSILKDFFTLFIARIGQVVNDSFKPILKSAGDIFQEFFKNLSESAVRVLATVGSFGAFALSIASVTTAVSLLWKSLLVSHLLGPFIGTINMLRMAFFELSMAIKTIQTLSFGESIAMWGTSLGTLVGKLSLIAAGLGLVYTKWSTLQEIAKEGFGKNAERRQDLEIGVKQAREMHKAAMANLDLEAAPAGLKDQLAKNQKIKELLAAQQKFEDQAVNEMQIRRQADLAKAHFEMWKNERVGGDLGQKAIFEDRLRNYEKVRQGKGSWFETMSSYMSGDYAKYASYMSDIEAGNKIDNNVQKELEQVKFTNFREQAKIAFKIIGELSAEKFVEGMSNKFNVAGWKNFGFNAVNEKFQEMMKEFPDAKWKDLEIGKKPKGMKDEEWAGIADWKKLDFDKWMVENLKIYAEELKKKHEKELKEQEKRDEEENERHFQLFKEQEAKRKRHEDAIVDAKEDITKEYLDQFKRQDEKRRNFQPGSSDSWGFYTHTLQQSLKGPDYMKTISEITKEHKTVAEKTLAELEKQGVDTKAHQDRLEKEFAIIAIK